MEPHYRMHSFFKRLVASDQDTDFEARGPKVFGEAICGVNEVRGYDVRGINGEDRSEWCGSSGGGGEGAEGVDFVADEVDVVAGAEGH